MTDTYVVRHGTHSSEAFDPLKLHSSIVWACMAVRSYEGEAHAAAERVCKHVIDWLEEKTEVTSADIQRVAGDFLATYHPEAAYMYKQHNVIL
ncbi:MAG: ATP cone domain-containing protein [Candidatus Saccharimonadales bacterium]